MIKIGIVGYGGMGHYHHNNVLGFAKMEVVAAFDIDSAAKKRIEEKGIESAASFDELLEKVDVVIVATPNDCHFEYVERAANAKKHIICEKPAAMSADEYRNMAKAANRNGVTLVVHQNRRWDKDFLTMKNIVESGELGRVYRINSRVMAANGIPGGWRKLIKHGGGMMLDWGVHLIDQAFLISDFNDFDCEYSYVFGHEVEDGFILNLRKTGLVYSVCVDTNTFVKEPRWEIFGTKGTAVISDWDCSGKIVKLADSSVNNLVAITAGNGLTKTMANRDSSSLKELPIPNVEVELYPFYTMFLNAITGKAESVIKHEQVIKVLETMEAIGKVAKRLD